MACAFLYCLVLSLIAFGAFALDKWAARTDRRRIRERTLLLLAAAGGTPGAIAAQKMLRHKTQKQPFGTWLVLIAVAQGVLVVALLWAALR